MLKNHWFRNGCLFVLVCMLFPGCMKMSLEEAKKVTVAMDQKSFVPPPRRVTDILHILEKEAPLYSKNTLRLKSIAEASVPPNAVTSELADFYLQRGIAAMILGRSKQSLDDCQKALDLANKSMLYPRKDEIIFYFGVAKWHSGNLKQAIELLQQTSWGKHFSMSYLALIHASFGDIESCEYYSKLGTTVCESARPQVYRSIHCDRVLPYIKATLLEAKGKFIEAEPFRRDALSWALQKKDSYTTSHFALEDRTRLAANLQNQGRLFEAEIEARKAIAEAIAHGGKLSFWTAWAVGVLAEVMLDEGKLEDAEKLIRASIYIGTTLGLSDDSWSAGRTYPRLGNILFARQQFTEAMQPFDMVKGNMQFFYDKALTLNNNLLILLIKSGRLKEAEAYLSRNYDLFKRFLSDNDPLLAEIVGIRGMAHTVSGRNKQALADFSIALPSLIEARSNFRTNFSQKQRINMLLESYIELLTKIYKTPLEKESGIDAAAETFKIASIISAHTLENAVTASSARVAAANPQLADLVRKEQDAQKEIEVLQSMFTDALSVTTDKNTDVIIGNLKTKMDKLNQARTTLNEEIKKQFPKYADFTNPQPASPALIRTNLRSDEVLISIYPAENQTYVWAISNQVEMKFFVSPIGKKKINSLVAHLRKSLDSNPRTLGDIPPFDLAQSYELYSKLLKPAEDVWKGSNNLLIVTNGALSQLPFSLLVTAPASIGKDTDILFSSYRKVPWLINKVAITNLPSVSSLVALRELPAGDLNRKAFAGFGDPIFNKEQLTQMEKEKPRGMAIASRGSRLQIRGVRVCEKGGLDSKQINSTGLENLNRLPDTADEIKSIGLALGADLERDIFLGKNLSEYQIQTMNLTDRKVIAFATHALVPGDLDGLDQPALALSSPQVTGDNGDGLLTMGEIMKLKLNTDWVLLSACNTAAAEGAGAESLSGLGRAFFYAGTRAILASMWPVETTSAKKLVTGIFQKQRENKSLSRADALRKSILGMINDNNLVDPSSGRIAASYAHPLFWAPFVIVGDSGK